MPMSSQLNATHASSSARIEISPGRRHAHASTISPRSIHSPFYEISDRSGSSRPAASVLSLLDRKVGALEALTGTSPSSIHQPYFESRPASLNIVTSSWPAASDRALGGPTQRRGSISTRSGHSHPDPTTAGGTSLQARISDRRRGGSWETFTRTGLGCERRQPDTNSLEWTFMRCLARQGLQPPG